MKLVIEPSDEMLGRYGNAMAVIGKTGANKAQVRAVNHTARKARTAVVRAIAKQSSIPYRIVKQTVRLYQAKPGGVPVAEMVATGKPLSLRAMGAKQFSYGVKVKMWGKSVRMDGAFIYAGNHRSGKHVGNGHVFTRSTAKSLPIEKQLGPSIPEEMVRDQSAKAFTSIVQRDLPERLSHEIGRLLPKD